MDSDPKSPLIPRQLEHEIDSSPVRVSYIIATRNHGEYLKRTLTNIREFLGKEDELIVIDGGSTDGTAGVVQQNRDIVSAFVSEPDSSEGHAVNKAFLLARGRFIKPITDDDYVYPDAMRQLVATVEAHPEIDAIHTGGEVWEIVNGKPQFMYFKRLWSAENPSPLEIIDVNCGLGLIVRRRTLLKTGGISPGYLTVDTDWHCKLIEADCCVRYLDINLYRWTKYPHSGMMAEDRMHFDYLRYAVRLKDWNRFYGFEPSTAARLMGMDKVPEDRALQYAVFLAHRIWRHRTRILLRPLPLLVKFAQRARKISKQLTGRERSESKMESRAGNAGEPAPFTGKLFL